MLHGLMQDRPLLISDILDFAERHHGDTAVISRRVEGGIHRSSYAACAARARQVANAVEAERLAMSDRVGTLAWNGYRHVELYFGVAGSGRVLHTINPRLHPDQVAWIVNHADDRIICFDLSFLDLIGQIRDRCPGVKKWVVLCGPERLSDEDRASGLVSYEEWLAAQPIEYRWPVLDEHSASALCYTSGTTGDPKAVLYSHRSTVLHAYAIALPDAMAFSARDTLLPLVPMFHVNAWGIPYAAALTGAKLVLPGPQLNGASVYELIAAEGVTFVAGVPTVLQTLIAHVEAGRLGFGSLNRVVIGGAACPPAMLRELRENHGLEAIHSWGMTEMSPLGTLCTMKAKHNDLSADQQLPLRAKQGRAIFGVDMKIMDDTGTDLPWDGVSQGHLMVRGHWVVSSYFGAGGDKPVVDADGWFATGDVATIDADGFMQITDRSKDVIKSGGEWISSIEIENVAMAHPDVAMAACIGIPHPKWDERPILVVVPRPGASVDRAALLASYQGKIAKWQIPDDVVVVDSIPLGATGKMLKIRLREQLQDYQLP
ncbi:3-(methylthio)propionyl-CoA ligase [Sphingobium sp.]|uniref:3-(methylthio)propionyl-CoA ligase n=1 Tax=Sphingobium sp. TaxID=1912891 RepID=UPI002C786BE5|nr:3-(methylthio)propionyl-CoA ligase [Sphingobium sp.]HUD94900.1 3-(methylthio)propionyl-CoA ligase [Sphingobium sp.]